MNRRHRFAIVAVAAMLGTALIAPAASAKPPADKLERARSAVTTGQEKAKGFAKGHAEAPGQEDRVRGLERAEEAIADAADRKAARDTAKVAGDNPGRGLGRGHAADVHEYLLHDDYSPSDLESHGEAVRLLAHAFDKVKADHPGRGNGPTEKGDDDAEDPEDDRDRVCVPAPDKDEQLGGKVRKSRQAAGGHGGDHPAGGDERQLVRQAAEALKAAQTELRSKGLSLKVYDCYRPARAVAAFVAWSKLPDDPREKALHYPDLAKSELFPAYIATRSSHSRGATVDITLVPLDAPRQVETSPSNGDLPCTAPQAGLRHGLDMGIGFDCFDPKANTDAPGLTKEQHHNRELLLDIMSRHGFQNYKQEIWHFTLKGEPYPDTIFNFPIEPHARSKG